MVTFSTNWITVIGLVLGVVLPVIVNIVTTWKTTPQIRATFLAVLSLVTSILTQLSSALANHAVFNIGTALVATLGTFLIAVASAWGFWDPTKISSFLRHRVGVKHVTPADAPKG